MVRVDLPKAFTAKTRKDLLADATSIRLRDKSPTFYELAMLVARVSNHYEARRLPATTRAGLAARGRMIMDRAHNSLNQDISDFTNGLTDYEQHLFEQGYKFAKEQQQWRSRETERFNFLVNQRLAGSKRRR